MAKEFNKKFMHPTRRKLVDMVMSGGEYKKDTFVSFSDTKENIKRNIGDTWEDSEGNLWEQKEFGKVKKSKLTDTMAEVRQYLQEMSTCKADDCDVVGKYSRADKKLISKSGYCAGCLAKRELPIKLDGLWEAYEQYKIYSNMASYGTDILEKWNQALNDVTNIHTFINDDGSSEKWVHDADVDVLRKQIEDDIESGKKELIEVIEKRNAAYELLKDKNYELVKPLGE